jgi:hypothetical protein
MPELKLPVAGWGLPGGCPPARLQTSWGLWAASELTLRLAAWGPPGQYNTGGRAVRLEHAAVLRRAWRNGIMVMPMIIGARPCFTRSAGRGQAPLHHGQTSPESHGCIYKGAPPARLATAPAGARGALRRPLARQRRHSHFARCEDGAEPLRFTTLSVSSSRQQRAWQLG